MRTQIKLPLSLLSRSGVHEDGRRPYWVSIKHDTTTLSHRLFVPLPQTTTVTDFSTKTTAKEDYLVTDEDLKALSFISVGQRNDPPSFFPSILRAHHLSTPMLETRANVEATD
jgi:hypothetical protein